MHGQHRPCRLALRRQLSSLVLSENGGTHIGIYLAWIIHRRLGSKTLEKLDEKFLSELLNKEVRDFTRDYYESNEYLNDYDQTLGGGLETLYQVSDTWDNYDRIAQVLDERLQAWRNAREAPNVRSGPA